MGQHDGGAGEVRPRAFARPTLGASYVEPGPIEETLTARMGEGRVVFLGTGTKGHLLRVAFGSNLFQLEEAQGYNPAQPLRIFSLTREFSSQVVPHTKAVLVDPPPLALNLFQVRFLVNRGTRLPVPAIFLQRDGSSSLYLVRDAPARASLITRWSVLSDAGDVLEGLRDPGFDADREVLLEASPGIPGGRESGAPTGSATYRQLGPNAAASEVSVAIPISTFSLDAGPGWRMMAEIRQDVGAEDSVAQACR